MKPGNKYHFILKDEDRAIIIEKRNIGLEEGAWLFFKELQKKMGVRIKVFREKPKKEIYRLEGEY